MNRINIEFSIEIERVLPTRPQAKALIGSRPACPYPRGWGGQNQGHKDDRKVCLPTVRKSKREIVGGGKRRGRHRKRNSLGPRNRVTKLGQWVVATKLVLMLDSARAVKARSGLGSMHISIRQQSLQMVVMATEISLHRSIDERVCLSNCSSVNLTDCLPVCLSRLPLR